MAERVVLVHGSVIGGPQTWSAQRPLGDRFDLVVLERPGFPPNPPVQRVDFEEQAHMLCAQIGEGDHLVGHSYGGVICLLAAACGGRPGAVAHRDRAAVHAGRARQSCRRSLRPRRRGLVGAWAAGRPGGLPACLPAGRRLRLRPTLPPAARARAGCARPRRGARAVGGRDPARGARGRPVPEARRLGRPPRRLRRRLRRPRGAPGRRVPRPAGLRPRGAAAPGVQRRAGRLRRPGQR